MTIRLALALLFIVPAAMAYPLDSDIERWTLGIAIAVVLVLFAWWRGLFVTNMIGRRLAVWRRNHSTPKLLAPTKRRYCCGSTILPGSDCHYRSSPATWIASASGARRCASRAETRVVPARHGSA